jgi:hypothetical protein
MHPTSTISIHRELEKINSQVHECQMVAVIEAWLEKWQCASLHDYTSNMKVCMGGLSTEGEHSSMVEDAPATI